ncbi:hypothetical protein SLS58_007145 [Diplodia intermedia]|uniref:DUF7730 domain-containing protein n=1 Tax=Diplodia intermedia TaxID=856260 RepID=A0ABR3TLU6_9PEZI
MPFIPGDPVHHDDSVAYCDMPLYPPTKKRKRTSFPSPSPSKKPKPDQPKPDQPTTSSGWNSLPGEIKNKIYEYILIADAPIKVYHHTEFKRDLHHRGDGSRWLRVATGSDQGKEAARDDLGTSLFRVDRQMYREAAPLFYSRNTFCFADWKKLRVWTEELAPEPMAWVKSVTCVFSEGTVTMDVWDYYCRAYGLKKLRGRD